MTLIIHLPLKLQQIEQKYDRHKNSIFPIKFEKLSFKGNNLPGRYVYTISRFL
ncbi:hypothetical protein B14911_19725 [Bacillus sp. NRRL B-14911]|nr:hypothetical protein B14911_19725 [Bacillus sp. NRRL B-14911]